MKKSILFFLALVFLTVLASGCIPASVPVSTSAPPTLAPPPVPPTSTAETTATATSTPSSWEVYTNEFFSLEHPAAWVVSEYGTASGFIGKQVFWCAVNYDPMRQPGDAPAVDQMAETNIDGQRATRILGHYLGAIGDMGYQQYLRYVIQKGDAFYMFALFAVDALGVPPDMMTETLPLRENDVTLFEQMMATMKFKD